MKLQVPFLQLPVSFDAQALAHEIAQVDESHWRPHPNKLPGNSALTLIATNGEPDNDDLVGNMRPTAALDRNLCRCGSHNRLVRAVLRAAVLMREAQA